VVGALHHKLGWHSGASFLTQNLLSVRVCNASNIMEMWHSGHGSHNIRAHVTCACNTRALTSCFLRLSERTTSRMGYPFCRNVQTQLQKTYLDRTHLGIQPLTFNRSSQCAMTSRLISGSHLHSKRKILAGFHIHMLKQSTCYIKRAIRLCLCTAACVWWMMMCRPSVRNFCLCVVKCCLIGLPLQPTGWPVPEVSR
jgi:hypothetical protein